MATTAAIAVPTILSVVKLLLLDDDDVSEGLDPGLAVGVVVDVDCRVLVANVVKESDGTVLWLPVVVLTVLDVTKVERVEVEEDLDVVVVDEAALDDGGRAR